MDRWKLKSGCPAGQVEIYGEICMREGMCISYRREITLQKVSSIMQLAVPGTVGSVLSQHIKNKLVLDVTCCKYILNCYIGLYRIIWIVHDFL